MKVVFRKTDGVITAFLPEVEVRYGNIMCYQHVGQHGEACVDFYNSSKKALSHEYEDLKLELERIYEEPIEVRQRMDWNLMRSNWK